jgi:bifunctional DNA-binding transcriptional regulator/antitoxin component of YhaV-PrlF toxin-antitoxin module
MVATEKSKIVHLLRGGQITIPIEFRRLLGISESSLLEITLAGDELRIRVVEPTIRAGSTTWFRELYDLFAPVREEAAKYSEEEVNAMIDDAVREVREARAQGRD